jgi:hypothetical protein
MTVYEYKVVPFVAVVQKNDRKGVTETANTLQTLLNQNATEGWEFLRIDRVQSVVASGLRTAMFGGQEEYIGFDEVIFRKPQE